MKAWRWICLLLAVLAVGGAGCASTDDDVSSIPWNRPERWEGAGALGGMPMKGGPSY